jgi:hypothetical protein
VGFTAQALDALAVTAGVERAAITRRTLQGGVLGLFAPVTITAPGMPVVC